MAGQKASTCGLIVLLEGESQAGLIKSSRIDKVKQGCVNLGLVVHSSHLVVDCLEELRFTRQS